MATSIGAHRKVRWKSVLNFLAVAGPIICLIDCVVLPIASALLPFLGMTEFGHGINDQQLFLLVVAICGPIIIPGYLKHRNKRVLSMFITAISMMFIVNFVDLIGDETAHAVISLMAACLLIKANRDNKKLLSCACSMHHHGAVHEIPAETTLALNQTVEVETAHNHSACSADHSHSHSHSHAHSHAHNHAHDHAAGPCLHDVVIALDMVDHGLDPNHFEPRNNLNFDPAVTIEAPNMVTPSPAVSTCCV
jgi:hypothetical protein